MRADERKTGETVVAVDGLESSPGCIIGMENLIAGESVYRYG